MKVVVVESPAKAQTIEKYLGKDYKVFASYGHIRDLPSKNGSVQVDNDFAFTWEIDGGSEKHIKRIADATKGADMLYLATDPDREGEAISWHVQEVLREKKLLGKIPVKRIVFNEITKTAVNKALENPRDVDQSLVDAYLARRALDYLVGFTLSPILWRKLPGSRSAGRVQSVALRLLAEREAEIESFKPEEYWSVEALFATLKAEDFKTRLTHLRGKKLDKFSLNNQALAEDAVAVLKAGTAYKLIQREAKQVKRHPQAPFTTSTLQQDASRKLGFGASRTMQTAQRLYEGISINGETVGLITYMRTDGVQVADEAMQATRHMIQDSFGKKYLPDAPRVYKTKAKNAQEAHEAIRPTDLTRTPDKIRAYLDEGQFRLYELIWKRMVASQMESALFDQVALDIADQAQQVQCRATGSTLVFDGFLTLYRESKDEEEDEKDITLPFVEVGQALDLKQVTPNQHFTQPPPRFTEASLVKQLEELGIGRPSTYASILQVLQDRGYARLERKTFFPEDRGRLVTSFLTHYFARYVEYDFTAKLEQQLDDISDGSIAWRNVLQQFWTEFKAATESTKDLTITKVLDVLDADLGAHFFHSDNPDIDPRECPQCKEGRLNLKLGKFGAFIGCTRYPECRYTKPLAPTEEGQETSAWEDKLIGQDPTSGLEINLKKGMYGLYLQRGDAAPAKKGRKKASEAAIPTPTARAAIPTHISPDEVTLPVALQLLSLPRAVGLHPEDNEVIKAGFGRFGPYLLYKGKYKSLKAPEDVLGISLEDAVAKLAEPASPRKGFARKGSSKSGAKKTTKVTAKSKKTRS